MDIINLISDDDDTCEIDLCQPTECVSNPVGSLSDTEGSQSDTVGTRASIPNVGTFDTDEDGNIVITRNIKCRHFRKLHNFPALLETSEEGYASFIKVSSPTEVPTGFEQGDNLVHRICRDASYSLRFKPGRKYSLTLSECDHSVTRKTEMCTGIKCCSNSVQHCSNPTSSTVREHSVLRTSPVEQA